MKITSNIRFGYDWRISYRYYLDGIDLWFNFKDICEFLNITSEKFIDKYFEQIPSCNKVIFEDNMDVFGNITNRPSQAKFINEAAFDELSRVVAEHFGMLQHDIQLLKSDLGLQCNSNYNCKHLIGNITSELCKTEGDINKVRQYTSDLFKTPELQSIINSKPTNEHVDRFIEWMENDEGKAFIAYKENNEVQINREFSMEEAVDLIYKYLEQE